MIVLHAALSITIQREDVKGLHEIQWRQIREVGESQVGKFLGLGEKYNDRHIHLLQSWVLDS